MSQYLERHAEPESRLAERLEGRFEAALVVPAHRESASLLDGFGAAGSGAGGRLLVILVVNAARGASPEALSDTRRLLREIDERCGRPEIIFDAPPLRRYELAAFTLLVIDRASPGFELPEKQGVGLARKIGCDLACALLEREALALSFVFSSDADVELPLDYVERARHQGGTNPAGLLYPFRHVASGEVAVDEATTTYELMLRYHVLGLRSAGAPYAFHTIGSTLCIESDAYQKVRGFPKRLAGEDFYLLDKLAKLGTLEACPGKPVRIRSRLSERVPFGTGPRVAELVRDRSTGAPARIYDPEVYALLGRTLSALGELGETRDLAAFARSVPEIALGALSQAGFEVEAQRALAESKTRPVLARRLFTWFDALRTLRFIHALRDSAFSDVPLRNALRAAPFVPELAREASEPEALEHLRSADEASPGPWGVTSAVRALAARDAR